MEKLPFNSYLNIEKTGERCNGGAPQHQQRTALHPWGSVSGDCSMVRKRRAYARPFNFLSPLVGATSRPPKASLPGQSEGDGSAVIASYNIHKCVGLDGKFDRERTVAVIKEMGPDVIALQEVDERFGNRAGLLDLKALKRECGLVPVPLNATRSSHGWHGNLLLVRAGTAAAARQLVLPGAEPRGALVIELALAAGPLRVIAAHLGLLRRSRARQIKALLSAARLEEGRPTLILGDLNEWRLGTRSSLRALEPAFGPLRPTFPSFPSRFPIWSLDRILANPPEILTNIVVHDTPLARIASDHLPIKAAIALQKSEAESDVSGAASAA